MKAFIVKARDKFKAGDEVDVTSEQFAVLAEGGYAITESEKASRDAVKAKDVTAIKGAITRAKARGAIDLKDTAIEAKSLERLEKGVDSEVLCELIDTTPSKELADLNARVTARIADDGSLELGTGGASQIRVGASLRDVAENGYLKAREPMDKLIRAGGASMKEAAKISRETSSRLMGHLMPIYVKGGDLNLREAVKDVVRAADNVDTNVGTLNTGIVLMRNMGFLKNKLSFLDKISTDLRNEPVQFGQNVLTRYITPPGVLTFVPGIGLTSDAAAIAAWTATITATNPAGTPQTGTQTRSQASATDISVVLNKYKGVSIKFNNLTISGTMRNLFAEQQAAQIYSLAEQVNIDFLTTLFTANWAGISTAPFSVNGGSAVLNTFGLANIIAIKNKFSLNKMADVGRFALLHSSYHDAILTDSNLLTAKAILSLIKKDNGSFEDGELPVLFGVKVLESQLSAAKNGALVTITDPTTIPAVADTIGFAGNSSSAVFVARVPQDYTNILGEIPATAALEIVTDPDSGLSMLVKKRVDHNLEETLVDCGLMYNFAQGDKRQGFILKP